MSYQPFSFDSGHIDLNDMTVLITGGTGSFGKAFVRTALASAEMRRCIMFSRDEQKHYDMAQEFPSVSEKPIRYFIGDVRDVDRLELAMRGVDYVIHAAAMKHIPASEYNPFECVQTNIYGAENIVKAALRTGVKKVIALSTDKAANPINLYGATKLASDKIFIAANNIAGTDGCRFSVVRYGNVIGSRGSVIPFFRKLIDEQSPDLPITDERMTRFWITLQQGVNFVLCSLQMMKGREIFVPKIPSMKITDVAKTMAPDLPLRNVGIRPGEKLHEVMISEDDSRTTVEMEDRYVILPAYSERVLDDYLEEGHKLVPTGFHYASDTNTDWLDGDDLKRMVSSL